MMPEDPMFAALLREVQAMLNEPDIRAEDNFVELGGNSMMAILIVEKLRAREGIEANLAQLLGSQIGQVELMLAAK